MATIKDVAKLAGVSVATVSNILNHKTYVSDEKYKKVMSVIEELNYTPNYLASNLKANKAGLVAVIVPEYSSFYSQIVKGAQQLLENEGYSIIIKTTNYNSYVESMALSEVCGMGISGVLLASSSMNNSESYYALQKKAIPVIFLCSQPDNYDFSSVIFDNERILYNSVLEIAEGLELPPRICLIAGIEDYSEEEQCVKGFCRAVNETGCRGQVCRVRMLQELAFIDLMEIIPNLEEMPDYFIVTNQNIAESLVNVLSGKGIERAIYILNGEESDVLTKEGVINICRSSISMGREGAKLVLEYNKSPIFSENRTVVLKQYQEAFEQLNWKRAVHKRIRMLVVDDLQASAALKLAPFFEHEYGIEVESEALSHAHLYNRIIAENKKESSDFDIFMVDYQWFPVLMNEGYMLDFRQYIEEDQDRFLDGFLPIARHEFIERERGRILTLPLLATMQFLFYRRDLFEDKDLQWRFFKKYGVELRPPRTWAEFDVIAQYFTRSFNPESPVKYGTTLNNLSDISICEQFFPRQWACRGSIISKGNVVFQTQANRRALESIYNAYRCSPFVDHIMEESSGRILSADNTGNILHGDIAMCMTYATHIPCTMGGKEQTVDYSNILATRVPGNCPLLGGWSLAINRYTENPFESYMYMKWATSNRNAVRNALLGGFVPKNMVREDVHINYVYPWIKTLLENFGYAMNRKPMYDHRKRLIDPFKIDATIGGTLMQLFRGESDMNTVQKLLQNEFETLQKGKTW